MACSGFEHPITQMFKDDRRARPQLGEEPYVGHIAAGVTTLSDRSLDATAVQQPERGRHAPTL
jgi:hypothetical protein